jgi:hypothetical protein
MVAGPGNSAVLDKALAGVPRHGQVESRGDFTLDIKKARDKLRRFQLLSPHLYVLELVGAAVSGGAREIEVTTTAEGIRFVMPGMKPYSRSELINLYSHLFLSQTDRKNDRLRQLAICINSALGLDPEHIEIRSENGDEALVLKLTPRGGQEIHSEMGRGAMCNSLYIAMPPGLGVLRRVTNFWPEQAIVFLKARCRYATVPILLNGRSINVPVDLEPHLSQISVERGGVRATLALPSSIPVGLQKYLDERERYGQLVWVTGKAPGSALEDGRVIFQFSGVMLCHRDMELATLPVVALCEAPGLLKNASQSDVVETARFEDVIRTLEDMVPDLVEEVKRAHERLRMVCRDPRFLPREATSARLFKYYLEQELFLMENYVKRSEEWLRERGSTPRATVTALPLDAAAAEEAALQEEREVLMAADEELADARYVLSRRIETADMRGFVGLPPWEENEPVPPCELMVTWKETSRKADPGRINVPLAGFIEGSGLLMSVAMPGRNDIIPHYAKVQEICARVYEQLIERLTRRYDELAGDRASDARRHLLHYLFDKVGTLQQFAHAGGVRRAIRELPLFPTTDGNPISMRDVIDQYTDMGELCYVTAHIKGRPLDTKRKVLLLSPVELEMMRRVFPQSRDYGAELIEDERARELQRVRGSVAPGVDPAQALVWGENVLEGLSLHLGLLRPFNENAALAIYKKGVLIESRQWTPGRGLLVAGWIDGDALPVDNEWQHVRLSDKQNEAIEQRVTALYRSLADAMHKLDPTHPDWETASRYMAHFMLAHRAEFLSERPPFHLTPFLDVGFMPGVAAQHRHCLDDLLRHYRDNGSVYYFDGVRPLLPPAEPIINWTAQPWLGEFCRAFFGAERMVPWTLPEERPTVQMAPHMRADAGPAEAVAQALSDLLGRPVKEGERGAAPAGSRALAWERGGVWYLNTSNVTVRKCMRRVHEDPDCVLHLAMALYATNPRTATAVDRELESRFVVEMMRRAAHR